MRKLFIVGFPGLYGGAGTELHAQIVLWAKAFPEIELHIIPTSEGFRNEPLFDEMVKLGVAIEERLNFECISSEDAVINFCSKEFLNNLELINSFSKRVMWVNCMTFLFEKELEDAHKNLISHYLYQRPQIRDFHEFELKKLGSSASFDTFIPYFNADGFEFSVKDQEFTHIGRISRQDADKFSEKTLHIYEYITSPKMKRGHFLGWGQNAKQKIGEPFQWIRTYADQKILPVKRFYDMVDFIVQPTNTNENWPRIGFEAMFTGKPLVVDNRGGWQHMIEHGFNGFLCKNEREFIYWGTRLAFEYDLRQFIARNALKRAMELSSFEASKESWGKIFDSVYA